MKSILYFALLFVVFGSLSLFATEQFEEEKIDIDDSIGSVRENIGTRKSLEQDLPKNVTQEDKQESSKGDSINVDKLDVEKIQDIKIEEAANEKELQHHESKIPVVEKTISEGKKIDRDLSEFSNNLPEESMGEFAQDLPSIANKEVNKDLKKEPLSLNVKLNEDIVNPQENLQIDHEVDVEENKSSENSVDKLLEEKKEKMEGQAVKEEVKGLAGDSNGKNQVEPITKKDEESTQEKGKNLQKWTKLNRKPIEEWYHKNTQSKSIYKRQYDNLNEHLPKTIFIDDYSKQLFYCIKKNNLVCLGGIVNKLEKVGLTTKEILKFRNKLGDTPLIYAVKQGEIDIVRFLLLQGADPKVVNNGFQSPLDIAIERKRVDIINVIAEMTSHLLEHKRIDNKENLEMYDWAVKIKENNESQCNEN